MNDDSRRGVRPGRRRPAASHPPGTSCRPAPEASSMIACSCANCRPPRRADRSSRLPLAVNCCCGCCAVSSAPSSSAWPSLAFRYYAVEDRRQLHGLVGLLRHPRSSGCSSSSPTLLVRNKQITTMSAIYFGLLLGLLLGHILSTALEPFLFDCRSRTRPRHRRAARCRAAHHRRLLLHLRLDAAADQGRIPLHHPLRGVLQADQGEPSRWFWTPV